MLSLQNVMRIVENVMHTFNLPSTEIVVLNVWLHKCVRALYAVLQSKTFYNKAKHWVENRNIAAWDVLPKHAHTTTFHSPNV